MIHPSYSELIEAINTNNEDDDESMVLNSRYSLILATSKRARQLIGGAKPFTQAQLATRIGSTESAISRFVSGKTDKISTEHLLRIAKVFEVSTDFLLGEVNTPDRTNFDIEELGLSVQAARNLYTGKANAEILRKLLSFLAFKIASITENSGASASHSALNAGSFIWSFRKSLRFVIWNFPFWKDNLLYTF